MYYLKVVAQGAPQEHRIGPRDIVQGPFASASEAKGYWTKLKMWFPDSMQEANYRIMDHEPRGEVAPSRKSAR